MSALLSILDQTRSKPTHPSQESEQEEMSYFEAHSGTATTGKPANIQTETTSTGAAGPRSPRSPTVEAAERVSEEAKKKTIHALYNGKDKVRNVATNMRTTFIETINAHPALRVAIFFSLFMLALPPLIAISASLLTLSTFGFFASLVVIAAGLPVVAVSGIGGMVGTGAMAWLVAVFGSMGGTIGWVWYRGIPLVKAYMRMGVESVKTEVGRAQHRANENLEHHKHKQHEAEKTK